MAGEGVNVVNALGFPAARRCAAHALVQRDAHARGQALERADDKFFAVEEIKPGPVDVRQGVIDQCREVGGVGNGIGFAVKQRDRLTGKAGVVFGFAGVGSGVGGQVNHFYQYSLRIMRTPVLITGTDTGCGKTRVACALLHALRVRGLRASGMKPVASGCVPTPEGLRNADALALQAVSGAAADYANVNPYPLPAATAPSLAARAAGITVEPTRIEAAFARLAASADVVVVEGAGGWAAPLGDGLEHADLARRLRVDVVLVVGLRLGCLNHARLTARAIHADGCRLRGWIGSRIEPEFERLDEYLGLLRAALPAPCLGVLPYAPDGGAFDCSALTLDSLLD